MLRTIWEDVRREFGYGNIVSRLIIINASIFVIINIVGIILFAVNGAKPSPVFDKVVELFSMPANWKLALTHPWAIFTHMFLHTAFMHILFNMLFLYWFGRIVGDFIGYHRILPVYLMGGLVGMVFFMLSANLLDYSGRYALGASAAVMAITTAAGTITPNYIMRLLFIGDVKLKYIVIALVFLDLVSIANASNTGGHFAHLGGALFGWVYILQLQVGNDWAKPVNHFFDKVTSLFNPEEEPPRRNGPRAVYRNPQAATRKPKVAVKKGHSVSDTTEMSYQEQLDAILDKIKQSGYDSLSAEEKEFLFNASKR